MPTLREDPQDAEIASHKLLVRAGMIRKNVSGIYTYLPLGYRVIRKIEQIVRQEMENSGSIECLLSAVQPAEIWQASGRWDTFGPEMFKLHDRNERNFCLGPTHEEYFTTVIKDNIRSYKQLPLNLYQIQTKYRDEKRPRFGVIRAREFIMKDAYSFDTGVEGMEESYMEMWRAYERSFDRMKIDYKIVEGDSGAMGGRKSHEFIALAESGEGEIFYCTKCDYAATDEKAAVDYKFEETDELKELEEIHTPDIKTIEQLEEFLKIDASHFAKIIIFKHISGEIIAALIPGDRELNEIKLFNAAKVNSFDMESASEEDIFKLTGAKAGFSGPIGLKDAKLYIDERLTKMKNLVVGANKDDMHIKNTNYKRDFDGIIVKDLLQAREGDICPKCGNETHIERGIEIGNIFQLGTKYAESLHASYLDKDGKENPIYMGSYGIGVSRTLAAIVEQFHDENGIIWPLIVAPYQIIITLINKKDEQQTRLATEIYEELKAKGYEVLLDDRDERAGVKFNDRDLIGIPLRVTVGKKASENIVEFSKRTDMKNEEIEKSILFDYINEAFLENEVIFL